MVTTLDDQQATIAFLSRPDSHGVTGTVERIDTHAAIIFLAGDHVWKLKRAVHYSYLDFSTPEKRKAVCEAELALNRRTAPELYREVRSVNRLADGSLGFGEGKPVDWFVVMRRFDSACLLEAVAAQGGLDTAMVHSLADHIAEFHRAAEVCPASDGAARLGKVIDGNRASMAALPTGSLPQDQCDTLYQRSRFALDKIAPLLNERARNGHVRHCHGDMHLANICLWQGRPMLFDCLEFDTELATTDVLYDLAFLVMDLWEQGYRAQANRLFNRYLDSCNEQSGIAAMPLFLSVRAAIRAHVTALGASRQSTQAGSDSKLRIARAYLDAALAFLVPGDPCLIAIGGLSGTGKSTLAANLAPWVGGAPGARWLRSDVLRKRMAGVLPEQRLPPEAYSRQGNAAVYERLMGEVATVLEAGHPVIVDAVFARPEERDRIASLARKSGIPFLGIWLEASAEAMMSRVTSRTNDASDADRNVVENQMGYAIGDLGGWHRINADGSPQEVVESARTFVAQAEHPPRSQS